MMQKIIVKSKKGFTLIELIVVLAILAIIAAIAVPTAFGSIETAKDAAAHASINSMNSVIRTTSQMIVLNHKVDGYGKEVFVDYKNGQFSNAGKVTNPYVEYYVKMLQESGMHAPKDSYFYIYISKNLANGEFLYYIYYSPEGVDKLAKPYYVYYSETGEIKDVK